MTSIIKPTDIVGSIPDSPIIDIVRLGRNVPDIIPLWLGEGDAPTPDFISNAAIAALRAGLTFYTPNRGIPELREALIRYYQRTYAVDLPDNRVAATNSGMHGVNLIVTALLEPGDNAVLITPCWPNIDRAIRFSGSHTREVPMMVRDGVFDIDMQQVFDACDERTRFIYLATPGNPTGWTISIRQANELLAFAREHDTAIVADEVYQRLSFDDPVGFSFLSIADPDDPLFVVNSFSKCWAMTGWRLGWLVYPELFHDTFEKLSQFTISGSPAFLQHGAIAALDKGEAYVSKTRERARFTCRLVETELKKIDRVTSIPSKGGLYTMFGVDGVEDSVDFCKSAALEARVGLAPGSAFGKGGKSLIRLCHARSDQILMEALGRLEGLINVS